MENPFNCCGEPYSIEALKKCLIDAAGNFYRYCTKCVNGNPTFVDVYTGNTSGGIMYEENIADPKTGKPIPFYDKASKKAAMKIAKVREAGDRIHGERNEDHLHRKTYLT